MFGIGLSYLPTPLLGQDMTQGQFFTKAEEPSLSYYSPIAGGRIIGFIPFSRVSVLCEMQLVSFRIWTHVAVSVSYDNNHDTTGTFSLELVYSKNHFNFTKIFVLRLFKMVTNPTGFAWKEVWHQMFWWLRSANPEKFPDKFVWCV